MSRFRKQEAMSSCLQERILGWGASLVGFADLTGLVCLPFSHWPNAVSIAVALDREVMAGLRDGPTPEYYEEYERVNRLLNEIAAKCAEFVSSLGYGAEPFPATIVDKSRPDEYERTLSVAFQHKSAGTRAGLGWIGKSALLVTPQFGPRVRLATVFTDMPLDVGIAVTAGRCGDCRACLLACPAGAIKGQEWQVGLPREELIDAPGCRAKAKQLLLERVGVEDAVCGVCVSMCPVGQG
jgi:epoxyqueuosine reductase